MDVAAIKHGVRRKIICMHWTTQFLETVGVARACDPFVKTLIPWFSQQNSANFRYHANKKSLHLASQYVQYATSIVLYVNISLYTYITLPYHYITLHYITLHYIHMIYAYSYLCLYHFIFILILALHICSDPYVWQRIMQIDKFQRRKKLTIYSQDPFRCSHIVKPITIHHFFEKDLDQCLDQRFSQCCLS